MCLLKILYGLLYSLGHVLAKMLLQDRYGRALRLNLIGTVKDMNIGHTKFLSYRLQGRIGSSGPNQLTAQQLRFIIAVLIIKIPVELGIVDMVQDVAELLANF